MRWFALGLVLFVAGCGSKSHSFYPLEKGNSWTYTLRAGFLSKVEKIDVIEPVTVSGNKGWIIGGNLGRSRIAWINDLLVAEELPGTRVSPAIPLLDTANHKAKREWSGVITANGRPFDGTATLYQKPETYDLAGRKYKTIKAVLTIRSGERTIELTTWYADGYGPIRQEQRTNGLQDRAMERLTGP